MQGGGAYLSEGKFPCHISFFVYTFWRLLELSHKLNMTFLDFHTIQSDHNITAELFKYGLLWKLSKNFGFHRNQCKMQIFFRTCDSELIHFFSKPTSCIHWLCSVLSFYAALVFQRCLFWCAETKGQTCHQEN